MLEFKIHQERYGAEIHCSGSFVLGLTSDQYKLLEVQKLMDDTPNFLAAYKEMRFTVSSETARDLLNLGASLNVRELSPEGVEVVKELLGCGEIIALDCPERVLVQHLESGDYDYTEEWDGDYDFESVWLFEKKHGGWVEDYDDESEAKEHFLATLACYDQKERLEKARQNYNFTRSLGYVL